MENQERVFFVQKNKKGEFETESIWCSIIGENQFKIDNIPFIANRIALDDIILAEFDENENAYYFDDFVSISGNTTIRLFFYETNYIEDTRRILSKYGCETEVLLQKKIVAVNVPKQVDYSVIKHYLDNGEFKNKWIYEESCLAHNIDTAIDFG